MKTLNMNSSNITNCPRTKENRAEFGVAAQAATSIREAFRTALIHISDKTLVGRLTAAMLEIVKRDGIHDRGKRKVLAQNMLTLAGFEFNKQKLLESLFSPEYKISFDRSSGKLNLVVAEFMPVNQLSFPTGATHFQLSMLGALINFGQVGDQSIAKSSESFSLRQGAVPGIDMQLDLQPNSTDPLLVVLGIRFMQDLNGRKYLMQNGSFIAAKLVLVDIAFPNS